MLKEPNACFKVSWRDEMLSFIVPETVKLTPQPHVLSMYKKKSKA